MRLAKKHARAGRETKQQVGVALTGITGKTYHQLLDYPGAQLHPLSCPSNSEMASSCGLGGCAERSLPSPIQSIH